MICDEARVKEEEGQLELAAALYEQSLAQESMPLWAMLNLIGLYWQSSEFGFWNAVGLPLEFVKKAGNRLYELLPLASAQYPESTEVKFWSRYICWADLGEPLSLAECEQWMRDNPDDLTPVLYLYSQAGGEKWEAEALRLLEQCKPKKTLRAEYVTSVLEASYRSLHERHR